MELSFDVDAALSEVPVNLLPLIDNTDFKTIEDAVAFNAAGMDLVWNFVTTAGAFTQTAVTPTSAGTYDWTNQGNGIYTLEIPASAGASINNDTEGFGWFSGVITGVLPFRGPICCFRAAGINNLLIDDAFSATRGFTGTALPAVAAEAAGGLYTRGSGAGQINQNANGQVDSRAVAISNGVIAAATFAANALDAVWSTAVRVLTAATNLTTDLATPTNITAGTITTVSGNVNGSVGSVTGNVGGNVVGSVGSVTGNVTVGTNNDKTGYSLSAGAIQAIWDALTAALTTAGSIGKLLVDNINATISSRSSQTSVDDVPTVAEFNARTLVSADYATATGVADVPTVAEFNARTLLAADYFDPAVDTVIVGTNNDKTGYAIGVGGIAATSFAAGAIDSSALAQAACQEIADEILNRNIAGGGSGNTRNVRNCLRAIRNRVDGSTGTLVVYEEDDTTPSWTAALTRSAVNPIVEVNP